MIVLIRTNARADVDQAAYDALNARMTALATGMPGFVSAQGYQGEDGDEVFMATFESAETLAAWRDLPEHVEAQRVGRESIYASYRVQVCEVVRAYDFVLGR
jgi:heme-degrading monooxygenase HmoA